ncbi:MAG: cysteine desulfurase [Bacteroidales bacterium]|jgi:cysteine desulfurase/selenocysteine lyase|nr:cysteine desulfurase [Bacteroidales bacterium]
MDVQQIRKDFPILSQKIYGKPLVYFDNAATTQKPQCVLDSIVNFYTTYNSNIHRGVHFLSEKATEIYENARLKVKEFINAKSRTEIVFTKGSTEAINTLAYSFGEAYIKPGDELIISEMEHHSNIVPWQLMAQRRGAIIRVLPFYDNGELMEDMLEKLICDRTKIVCVTYVSNTLGTVNDVESIIKTAHAHNIPVLVDAAQAIQHLKIDVQKLDCDFLALSGHKVYAETGIGVLYGKEHFLEELPPYQGGGDMIKNVSFDLTTFAELPLKFEAGTSNFVGAGSLLTALNYVDSIGLDNIAKYEEQLLEYATKKIEEIGGVTIYGNAKHKASIVSFNIDGAHHYDVGMILDKLGVAVRTGTHCTEPIMKHYNITGTVRASFAMYNTFEEIDTLCEGIIKAKKMLR